MCVKLGCAAFSRLLLSWFPYGRQRKVALARLEDTCFCKCLTLLEVIARLGCLAEETFVVFTLVTLALKLCLHEYQEKHTSCQNLHVEDSCALEAE